MNERIEDMTDAEINELKRRAIERLQNKIAGEHPTKPKHVQSERVQDDDDDAQT